MRATSNRQSVLWLWTFVFQWACAALLFVGGTDLALGAEPKSEEAITEDHPILVAVLASVDKVMERLQLMADATNRDSSSDALQRMLSNFNAETLVDAKGIDTTKPLGVMVFFGISVPSEDEDQPAANETDDADASEDLLGLFERAIDSIDFERIVFAIPIKDYDELIAWLQITPIADTPKAFKDASGDMIYVKRRGDYLLTASDLDLLDHAVDPRPLFRSVLGKQDVAVSFQAKGLPIGLRTLGAEGIKSVYAATLQQRDDEPDHDYRLRRALGDLKLELLDLAVSHIDEVKLGARLNPDRRAFELEFDLIGKEDGKLPRFAAEWAPKRSTLAGLWQDDGPMSFGLSLAFPDRHARPIAGALRETLKQQSLAFGQDAAPIMEPLIAMGNVGAKLIESGQLDVLVTGTGPANKGSAIVGIKVPGGPQFPEQFQRLIELTASLKWNEVDAWRVATETVNGFPVHRMSAKVLGELFDWVVSQNDSSDGGISLMATSDAIWIATTDSKERNGVLDLLKLAAEYDPVKAPKTTAASNRKIAPFRMTLRTSQFKFSSSDGPSGNEDGTVITPANAEVDEKAKQERQIIQTIFEEKGDAIQAELRPTATGLKLTMHFEEAFVAWLGHLWTQAPADEATE